MYTWTAFVYDNSGGGAGGSVSFVAESELVQELTDTIEVIEIEAVIETPQINDIIEVVNPEEEIALDNFLEIPESIDET